MRNRHPRTSGVQQTNVSQHLTALRHERIVDFHEDGKLRPIAEAQLVRVILRLIRDDFPVVSRSKNAVRRLHSEDESWKRRMGSQQPATRSAGGRNRDVCAGELPIGAPPD